MTAGLFIQKITAPHEQKHFPTGQGRPQTQIDIDHGVARGAAFIVSDAGLVVVPDGFEADAHPPAVER